jgi:hypothetical protein
MHPFLFDTVSVYLLSWIVTAVIVLPLGTYAGTRAAGSRGGSALAMMATMVVVIVGSKLLFFIEAAYFPGDDYVPQAYRGPFHGFRIPGGIARCLH